MSQIKRSADVAIIGASLSGSSCAIELARQGLSAILMDHMPFPRRKACGEGLSYLATPYLNRIGIGIDMLEKRGAKLYGYHLYSSHSSSTKRTETAIRTETARCWGIPRHELDNEILKCARLEPAITIAIPEQVKTAIRHRESWELRTNLSIVSSQFLVLATGAHPQTLSQPFITCRRSSSTRVGLSTHGTLLQPSGYGEVAVIPLGDGEIYITPLGNGAANVSLVGTRAFIQSKRESTELADLICRSAGIDLVLSKSSLGASYFESMHHSLDPFLFLVGDALESFDPACGLGMTHALATGMKAGQSISRAKKGPRPIDAYAIEYATWHEDLAKGIRCYGKVLRTLISSFERFPLSTARASLIFGGITLRLIDGFTRKIRLEAN